MENTQFSKPNSKEWDANSFHQDNQMRVAAALNHGTYGDSSGIMTRHRAAMAARNIQPIEKPSSNSPLNTMYSLQNPLGAARVPINMPITPTTASSSCVSLPNSARSASPTNSIASTSRTSFSFQHNQPHSNAPTPSPKHSPNSLNNHQTSYFTSNQSQIPGIHSLIARSPSASSTTSNSSSIGPRRKTKLINETRRAICMYAEENPSARQEDIASHYQIERSTVSKILKQKDKWKSIIPGGASSRVAKHRPSKFPDIETRLSNWAQECAFTNFYLTDQAIRDKAKSVAVSLGYPEEKFKASSGWVEKFKERNNIKKGKVNGIINDGSPSSGLSERTTTMIRSDSYSPSPATTIKSNEDDDDYITSCNQIEPSTAAAAFVPVQFPQSAIPGPLSEQLANNQAQHQHYQRLQRPHFTHPSDWSMISNGRQLNQHHHHHTQTNQHNPQGRDDTQLLALASAAVAVDDLNHDVSRINHERGWIMDLRKKVSELDNVDNVHNNNANNINNNENYYNLLNRIKTDAIELKHCYDNGALTENSFKEGLEILSYLVRLDFNLYGIYDRRSYYNDRMNIVIDRLERQLQGD